MSTLELPLDVLLWELRGHWATGRQVLVTLTERCTIRSIVGKVERVATSGAFVVIDGWHIPTEDILRVGKPTVGDVERYRAEPTRK